MNIVPSELETYYEDWHMSPGRLAGGLFMDRPALANSTSGRSLN